MTLEKLTDFSPCKVGYKIVFEDLETKTLWGISNSSKELRVGEWLDEKEYRSVDVDTIIILSKPQAERYSAERYSVGWHVFHILKDAELVKSIHLSPTGYILRIIEVEVSESVATGCQFLAAKNLACTVAKKIKILKVLELKAAKPTWLIGIRT